MLLKKLTELNGVSGNENAVSNFILSEISKYADEITKDTLGNLIFYKKGKNPSGKTVGVFAHMDEVGLIATSITDDGYIKFSQVGGLDDRILLTQRVSVGDNAIKGIIGIKAVHLQTKDERKRVVKTEDMYIDIGAENKEEALKFVQKGDYISFDSGFVSLYGSRIKAKALDDRVGCAIMMDLIKNTYDEDIYFCFTVQEETGLRGASVLSRRLNPDISFVLESTTASDTAFSPKHLYSTSLGGGPVLTNMDRGAYSDKKLNEFVLGIAKENNIKYQYKLSANGGNDARALQTGASGSRVCSISLPCRYIHSPVCVADMEDFDSMKALIHNVLCKINTFSATEVK
ncbi:MAG: M42 family metallopeptidase [Clostridia bacterium]|nr:M42 family metallopeptidase [Clostridia bacterium]